MNDSTTNRRTVGLIAIIIVLVGIIVGPYILRLIPSESRQSPVCSPRLLYNATTELITPVGLLNSPYGGYSTGQLVGRPGAPAMIASNGSAVGVFTPAAWTISIREITPVGPGAGGSSCQTEGTASVEIQQGPYFLVGLLANGSESDVAEPDSAYQAGLNSTLGSGVLIFNNTFPSSNISTASTCGTAGALNMTAESSGLHVQIPVAIENVSINVSAFVPSEATYRYTLPEGLGSWQISNPGEYTGAGLAFAFLGRCS